MCLGWGLAKLLVVRGIMLGFETRLRQLEVKLPSLYSVLLENKLYGCKDRAGVRMILEGVGENPDREGLKETPARVARMYEEVFAGLTEDPAVHFATTFDEHCSEMVLVRDIYFYSMCEHHLVPFFGKAHIAYIPAADGRVCGLSKLARLVEVYAKRPQVQGV